jgi:hypothetical protein
LEKARIIASLADSEVLADMSSPIYRQVGPARLASRPSSNTYEGDGQVGGGSTPIWVRKEPMSQ